MYLIFPDISGLIRSIINIFENSARMLRERVKHCCDKVVNADVLTATLVTGCNTPSVFGSDEHIFDLMMDVFDLSGSAATERLNCGQREHRGGKLTGTEALPDGSVS